MNDIDKVLARIEAIRNSTDTLVTELGVRLARLEASRQKISSGVWVITYRDADTSDTVAHIASTQTLAEAWMRRQTAADWGNAGGFALSHEAIDNDAFAPLHAFYSLTGEPINSPPAPTSWSYVPPLEQRAWELYCDDSRRETIERGKSARAGSRWGHDRWQSLPADMQAEYLSRARGERGTNLERDHGTPAAGVAAAVHQGIVPAGSVIGIFLNQGPSGDRAAVLQHMHERDEARRPPLLAGDTYHAVAITLACGRTTRFARWTDIPLVDVPCPCGDPKHMVVRWMDDPKGPDGKPVTEGPPSSAHLNAAENVPGMPACSQAPGPSAAGARVREDIEVGFSDENVRKAASALLDVLMPNGEQAINRGNGEGGVAARSLIAAVRRGGVEGMHFGGRLWTDEAEWQRFNRKNSDLESENGTLRVQMGHLKEDLERHIETTARLVADRARLTGQLKDANEQVTGRIAEIAALNAELAAMRQERDEAKKTVFFTTTEFKDTIIRERDRALSDLALMTARAEQAELLSGQTQDALKQECSEHASTSGALKHWKEATETAEAEARHQKRRADARDYVGKELAKAREELAASNAKVASLTRELHAVRQLSPTDAVRQYEEIVSSNNACSARAEDARKERDEAQVQVAKLRTFKDFVHGRLDSMRIPANPGGPHTEQGCRIGDRLDIAARWQDRLIEAVGALKTMSARIDELLKRPGGSRFIEATTMLSPELTLWKADADSVLRRVDDQHAATYTEWLRRLLRDATQGWKVGRDCGAPFLAEVTTAISGNPPFNAPRSIVLFDGARALLRTAMRDLIRVTNNHDPECLLCTGDATPDGKRHRPSCTISHLRAVVGDA